MTDRDNLHFQAQAEHLSRATLGSTAQVEELHSAPQVEHLQTLSLAFLHDIKPRIDHHWIEQQPAR